MSKRNFYLIGFSLLMLFDTLTQSSFKLTTTHAGEFVPDVVWMITVLKNPWIYGAIAGYLGAFVTWMTLLKHAPVGPAFGASHLSIISVLIVSVGYFGEQLSTMQIVGALSIMLGVVFLSMSEAG